MRRSWELSDKFVVGYSGNIGRTHDLNVIMTAAQKLKDKQINFDIAHSVQAMNETAFFHLLNITYYI